MPTVFYVLSILVVNRIFLTPFLVLVSPESVDLGKLSSKELAWTLTEYFVENERVLDS